MASQHNYLPFVPFLGNIHLVHMYTMETFSKIDRELFFYLAAYALHMACVGLNPADGKRRALRSALCPPGALITELFCK